MPFAFLVDMMKPTRLVVSIYLSMIITCESCHFKSLFLMQVNLNFRKINKKKQVKINKEPQDPTGQKTTNRQSLGLNR